MARMKKIPQDIVGDIAILKFPYEMSKKEKKKLGEKFLKLHKNINTVLEKSGKFKGRLRKLETKFICGEKKKETIHIESGCKFFFDVDETYFSPRLSNERQLVADDIFKKASVGQRVLVMFAGVAPFPIVIAKKFKSGNKKGEIVSSEINRKASKFAKKNVLLNHVSSFVNVVSGDSKKLSSKVKGKFDFIVMPRPNLKDTFLKSALGFSKKGTRIYYYGFGSREDVLAEVKRDVGKKVGKVKIRKAGDIGPYIFRWLVEFQAG